MEITENIFKDWLKCKYKAFLKISGQTGTKSDYENMLCERRSEFKAEAVSKYFHAPNMRAIIPTIFDAATAIHVDPQKTYIDVEIKSNDIVSHCDAVEKISGNSKIGHFHYIPLLLNENDRVAKEDKLLLGFHGLALSNYQGRIPAFGKIIHGANFLSAKI